VAGDFRAHPRVCVCVFLFFRSTNPERKERLVVVYPKHFVPGRFSQRLAGTHSGNWVERDNVERCFDLESH